MNLRAEQVDSEKSLQRIESELSLFFCAINLQVFAPFRFVKGIPHDYSIQASQSRGK
jgi:hypothetical protein